jgi:hypothetical protein
VPLYVITELGVNGGEGGIKSCELRGFGARNQITIIGAVAGRTP